MKKTSTLKCVELFAGGGGLALGARNAGFASIASVEWDHNSCETLRQNAQILYDTDSAPVIEGDVRDFFPRTLKGEFDLLLGGPPCQPFSIGGRKQGDKDARDCFPHFLRILREAKPRVFLIENVKGLTSPRFSSYVEFILSQLQYVDHLPKELDDWEIQMARLQKLRTQNVSVDYKVSTKLLNSVDYGVPQSRERFFIVGVRSDLDLEWEWPTATHSKDALIYEKYVSGEYFRRHGLKAPTIPKELSSKVSALKIGPRPSTLAHRTVRDALKGLPEPVNGQPHPEIPNHIGIPGARSYAGHTGSPYDVPAKTLKAGVHGCPGGENMLAKEDGSVRYFTVREAARLQTFPDDYVFFGARSECMRQIGNAVAVDVGRVLVSQIARLLSRQPSRRKSVKHPDLQPTFG